MNSKKQSILLVVSLVIFGGLLVMVLMGRLGEKKDLPGGGQGENIVEETPTVPPLPTKTEEEKEVIRNIETLEVKITANGFEPASLVVKPNDQVDWINETTEDYKVVGEDWGGVTIGSGRRFTQSFKEVGTYSYSCELHPEEKGEIIVE